MMGLLKEVEFAIDERPLPVTETSASSVEPPSGAGGDSQADKAVDFLGQLSSLLAENERLSVTLKMLERKQETEEELDKLLRWTLPVLDGFERILAAGRDFPDDSAITNWLRSVEGLYFRLKNLLEGFGLVGIEAVGKPVDLNAHEVVEYRYSPDHEPETVIAVRQRGYALRGRLLREAKVVVATNERS